MKKKEKRRQPAVTNQSKRNTITYARIRAVCTPRVPTDASTYARILYHSPLVV